MIIHEITIFIYKFVDVFATAADSVVSSHVSETDLTLFVIQYYTSDVVAVTGVVVVVVVFVIVVVVDIVFSGTHVVVTQRRCCHCQSE